MQASHRCLARQRGERVQQRLPTGCLGIAVVDHDEQARIGEPPREVDEQPERRRIGPLHVVQHEQQTGRLRGRPQHVRDRLEQPEPLLGHRFRAPVRLRHVEHDRPDAVNAAHRLEARNGQ